MTFLLVTLTASGLFLLALVFVTPRDLEGETSVKVRRVLAGDTVIVARWNRCYTIRLDAIDCPEGGQLWGDKATAGLIALIGGKRVRARVHSQDSHGRTLATLYVRKQRSYKWINVNARMVALGHAWVYREKYQHLPKRRRDELDRMERWAQSRRLGLWQSDDPTPPWAWRKTS